LELRLHDLRDAHWGFLVRTKKRAQFLEEWRSSSLDAGIAWEVSEKLRTPRVQGQGKNDNIAFSSAIFSLKDEWNAFLSCITGRCWMWSSKSWDFIFILLDIDSNTTRQFHFVHLSCLTFTRFRSTGQLQKKSWSRSFSTSQHQKKTYRTTCIWSRAGTCWRTSARTWRRPAGFLKKLGPNLT
jgi:hypothetical protein